MAVAVVGDGHGDGLGGGVEGPAVGGRVGLGHGVVVGAGLGERDGAEVDLGGAGRAERGGAGVAIGHRGLDALAGGVGAGLDLEGEGRLVEAGAGHGLGRDGVAVGVVVVDHDLLGRIRIGNSQAVLVAVVLHGRYGQLAGAIGFDDDRCRMLGAVI